MRSTVVLFSCCAALGVAAYFSGVGVSQETSPPSTISSTSLECPERTVIITRGRAAWKRWSTSGRRYVQMESAAAMRTAPAAAGRRSWTA